MTLTPQQKLADIFDALRVVADVMKVPVLDAELRQTAARLIPFHGEKLGRIITSIPERRYFPSGHELEQMLRKEFGQAPLAPVNPPAPRAEPITRLRGIAIADEPSRRAPSETKIEQWEREAVVGGQSPAAAKAGADLMRSSREGAAKRQQEREARANGKAIERPTPEPRLELSSDFDDEILEALEEF